MIPIILSLGGLFKIYSDLKVRETADYVIDADAEFGAGHLQHAVLPGTVSIFLKYFTLNTLIRHT